MKEEINLDEEFEYNDGLGDLLREKDKHEFSWGKTLLVVASLLTVVALGLALVFQIVRSLTLKAPVADYQLEQSILQNVPKEEPVKEVPVQAETVVLSVSASVPETKEVALQVAPAPRKPASDHSLYRVVVASFMQSAPAQKMVRELKAKKIDCYVWTYRGEGKTVYRVQVGAFRRAEMAKNLENQMKAKGLDAYVVKQ